MPLPENRENPFFSAIRTVNAVHTNQWEIAIGNEGDNIIYFLARSVGLPFWKLETEMHPGTGVTYYTGMNRSLDFSIEFTETENFNCYKYFLAWQDLIFNRSSMLFQDPVEDTKRFFTIKFVKMTAANSRTSIATFKLVGVLIQGMDEYSLSYDSGEPLVTKVNFTCDKVEITFP